MHVDLAPLDLDTADVVTFPALELVGDAIFDRDCGDEIPVNALARRIVELCDGRRTWGQVSEVVRTQLPPGAQQRVASDLFEFLTAAEGRSLVHIKRDVRARLSLSSLALRSRELVSLSPRRLERRRYPPDLRGVVRATVRALRLGITLGVWVAPLMFVALLVQGVSVGALIGAPLVPLAVVAFVGATIVLHEFGHLACISPDDRSHAWVVSDNLAVEVHHRQRLDQDPVRVRLAAAAGPCLAATSALAAAVLLVMFEASPSGVSYFPATVAVAHLGSLTPWARDGRLLFGRTEAPNASA